jgi:phosphopantetheinyl transferase
MEKARRLTGATRLHFKNRRAALRLVLGRYLPRSPTSLEFRSGPNGKPSLAGNDLDFSLSSSRNIMAIAVTRDCEIGIDVEELRKIEDHGRIAGHFFRPEELDAVSRMTSSAIDEVFLRIWVRKEAVLKAAGAGISEGLSVKVPVQAGLQGTRLDLEQYGGEFYLYDLNVGPRFTGALATRKPVTSIVERTFVESI